MPAPTRWGLDRALRIARPAEIRGAVMVGAELGLIGKAGITGRPSPSARPPIRV
jgi:hypothetical protein